MKKVFGIALFLLVLVIAATAQGPTTAQQSGGDITGLYSFIHEGEFVQIEVDDGKVTGLISHFKDEDLEKAEFVDQFFADAKLEGQALSFRTKAVGGVSYEFSGTVERGSAKTPADEGYWIIKGTLIVRHSGADGKNSEKSQTLTLRSFPQDTEPNLPKGASNKE